MGLLDDLRNASSETTDPNIEFAQAWRWENPGDGVEGTVVSVSSRVHDNHPEGYPIVVLRLADGSDAAVHGMTTVLKNEINERNLRAGDMFAAIYDGKKSSGAGRSYHAFRVASKPGNGVVPPNLSVAEAASEQADPPF